MSETRVVHVNDHIEGAVYIGRAMPRQGLRASPFANPHKITAEVSRQTAVDLFEDDILEGPLRPLLADLPALRGLPLACWCRRHDELPTVANQCHGDVLVKILEENSDSVLRMIAAPLFDERACRVCGCTDDNACEGGCYWIEWDLCSACAAAEGIPPPLPEWRQRQLMSDYEDRIHELEEAVLDLQERIT